MDDKYFNNRYFFGSTNQKKTVSLAHRPISPTGQDPQIWHFSVELQPGNTRGQGAEPKCEMEPQHQPRRDH